MGPAGTFGLLPHRCLKAPLKLQASGGEVGTGRVDGDSRVTGGIPSSKGLFGDSDTEPASLASQKGGGARFQ